MIHAFLLMASLAAAPVHIALRPASAVQANAEGFVTLGAVADLSGGAASARARLSAVLVARAPLPGEVRRLTRGDLSLKLRQAGCDPDRVAVLEGAASSEVTTAPLAPITAPPAPTTGGAGADAERANLSSPAPPLVGAGGVIVRRGDAVSIQIQDGALAITAAGVARENGAAGDIIRVHRDGLMTDLSVCVVDAQTVRMEL